MTLFAIDEDGHEFAIGTEGWSCPEICCSATSTLFFVTYGDGGAVGMYLNISTHEVQTCVRGAFLIHGIPLKPP